MLSYVSGSLSIFFFAWMVSKVGVYNKFYVERSVLYKEAQYLLQSNACLNPPQEQRQYLARMCSEKERVVWTKPWIAAIFDTADALSLPYTENLPKYLIGISIAAIVILIASGHQIRRNGQMADANYWRLPLKQHDVNKVD